MAWDNLCDPTRPPESINPLEDAGGLGSACLSGGLGKPRLRVPSLGLSADYHLFPVHPWQWENKVYFRFGFSCWFNLNFSWSFFLFFFFKFAL